MVISFVRVCVWIHTDYWKHTMFFFTSGARTVSAGLSTGFHRAPQTCIFLKTCCCNKSCCLTMGARCALCTWLNACWRQQEHDQNGSLMKCSSWLQLPANSAFSTQESTKANNRPSRHDQITRLQRQNGYSHLKTKTDQTPMTWFLCKHTGSSKTINK